GDPRQCAACRGIVVGGLPIARSVRADLGEAVSLARIAAGSRRFELRVAVRKNRGSCLRLAFGVRAAGGVEEASSVAKRKTRCGPARGGSETEREERSRRPSSCSKGCSPPSRRVRRAVVRNRG